MNHRPDIDRRTVLRGTVVGAAALLVAGSAAGCQQTGESAQVSADRLVPLVTAARAQQRTAEGLAPRITAYSAALTQVGRERGAHAEALTNEIKRLSTAAADGLTSASAAAGTTEPGTTAPGGGAPDVELQQLRDALSNAAAESTEAAAGESGYVAGLLGSIAAACTVAGEVQLA